MVNFLGNAVKFTDSGSVTLAVTSTARGGIRFSVTDTGPGFDPALTERLFQAFTQADASTTRKFGGTGLGLTICRQLVELMGGAIGADARPGKGATFWFELDSVACAQHDTCESGPDEYPMSGRAARPCRVYCAAGFPGSDPTSCVAGGR